jgi:uncharacterized protein involved in cysteine biosynthesis
MIRPCPLCGYALESVAAPCSACGSKPADPSLATPLGTWSGLRAAWVAVPRGLGLLVTTRGTKRWLIPPAVLTSAAFIALAWWLYELASAWVERGREWVESQAPQVEGFWRSTLVWLVEHSFAFALGKLTGFLLASTVSFVAALWTFSLLYELVAGPFLDEVHGSIERRWFGRNLRDERERPKGLTPGEVTKRMALCLTTGLVLVGASFTVDWPFATLAALGLTLLVVYGCARHSPAFGEWLAWRAAIELRTLAASLEATAIAAVMLVFALPLLLIPWFGTPLFALAAGFTTSISLLDIPMSRRRWGILLRLSFLAHHAPSVLVFGLVASLMFLVPVLGPLLMVPAASVGGLWLFVRLDKGVLSPRD